MSQFETVTLANFEDLVLRSDTPYLVEFGAVWCGPCKRVDPELERIQLFFGDRLRIGKLDVDEAADLALRYGVMSVPTVILFVNGEVCHRVSGFQPAARLQDQIQPFVAN